MALDLKTILWLVIMRKISEERTDHLKRSSYSSSSSAELSHSYIYHT